MAKHRIFQRPSCVDPSTALYDVEELCLWWWVNHGTFDTIEEAEQRIAYLKKTEKYKVQKRVIREYP
jgi:hypothetical protein